MSPDSRKEVTFLSNHYWGSERRAGFHGLAQAFYEAGWKVRFITTGLIPTLIDADSRRGFTRGHRRDSMRKTWRCFPWGQRSRFGRISRVMI